MIATETHYEILEVDPGASEEEVRKAYKRFKELYAPDSMVVYTLFTASELEALQDQLDKAYDTVIDPRKRREYDLSLLSQAEAAAPVQALDFVGRARGPMDSEPSRTGSPHPINRRPNIPDTLPDEVELNDDTVFTGKLLLEIREHRNVDLRDVSNHTKISLMNLRYIEAMQYEELPAPVYIRGFLREYAKYLHLPPKLVVDSYISLYEESLGGNEEENEN